MIDPAELYRDLVLCLPPNYTNADMARDFGRTFATDAGKRVLVQIWTAGGGMTGHEAKADPATGQIIPTSDQELRSLEGKRSLVLWILEMASAEAQEDGSAITPLAKLHQMTTGGENG